jgi:arsenate reductase (thioredoxin)
MRGRIFIYSFFLLLGVTKAFSQSEVKTILFVCEHGSAKSIIAAAHFQKLAKDEGLNIQVISRGVNPDPDIPEAINKHLESDGFERHSKIPTQLTMADLKNSNYVITFNTLPDEYGKLDNIQHWNIPSFEAGYAVAKDSILTNIKEIIVKIKSDTKNQEP